MEYSILLYLIESDYYAKWAAKSKKEIADSHYSVELKNAENKLRDALPDSNKHLLDRYSLVCENARDEFCEHIDKKILHIGVMIGLERQKAFAKFDGD